MVDSHGSGAILTIDVGAVVANYRTLQARLGPVPCAAVVKADAYGLGLAEVAPALAAAGCTTFFVAHLGEGVALRAHLPSPEIFVLNGPGEGEERIFEAHDLAPALNSLVQIDRWARFCRERGSRAAILHIDTGMSRLGLPEDEVERLAGDPGRLGGIDLRYVMTHLACPEESNHPMNEAQLAAFNAVRARLPKMRASLAASSAIFLGPRYHFDLARPGVALYGANPTPDRPNPMRPTITLEAPILQLREIDPPRTVGYGAAHRVARRTKIATIAIGYADGYLRSLSGRGLCHIAGHRVPVVGRVSMDLTTLDVTEVPASLIEPGRLVEVVGPNHPVDAVAEEAGTIAYEILTGLGSRYRRRYVRGDA
ncbi:MAG: alanine racemase [Alphaproteobacteria bacterium]